MTIESRRTAIERGCPCHRAEPSSATPPGSGPMQHADPSAPNHSGSGSIGDPRAATREKGEALLAAMVADMSEAVSTWLGRHDAADGSPKASITKL